MWGDTDHIKALKEREQEQWPDPGKPLTEKELKNLKLAEKAGLIDKTDLEVAKRLRKAGLEELKRGEQWPAKTGKGAKKPGIDISALAEAKWKADADAADYKAKQKALKATIKAEKKARKEQRQAEERERKFEREWQTLSQQSRKNGYSGSAGYSAPVQYADDQVAYGRSSRGGGCGMELLLALILLVVLLALCLCNCYT